MDMVIFRTIFFELFSFLHVHAPYPPFRLLMNLGMHQRQDKTLKSIRPIIMVHKHEHVILLLIVRGPCRRLLLHCILSHRLESRDNYRGYHPVIALYDLLSNW